MSGEASEQEVWYPAATMDAAIKAEVRAAVSAAGEVLAATGEGDPAGAADLEETMVVKYVPLPAPGESAPAPAVTTAEPAAALSPDQIGRHIARAEALAELGRRRQALDVLNELIAAGSQDVRVWRSLAAVYLETGDGEKALRAADWVVTFAPGDEWGHRLRASALRLLERTDEAVAAAEEAVRLGPQVWQSRASLAAALEASGDLSQAAAEARRASELAAELDPESEPEARHFEESVARADEDVPEPVAFVADLEAVLASRPGPDDESLAHVGTMVLRGMEFSAIAGWLVAFGGVAIPGFDIRFLIPLAVVAVLAVSLVGPARKAGRDLWRYLVEYLWQDTKTRVALVMTIAAHVFMITGSSLGHVQGGSTLMVGLISHLVGRLTLHRKAPELSPVRRGGAPAAPRSTAA
ncbi:tetratricopeptide repeat protein [Catenulispora sp. NF23]|uniref:Tetratricopeptide repeat protein n=1 Tax=Catenulispora pinistramenti TaxID=2705254 RepID=A0ABS5L1U8_9ACTN|nr:tetratricopeptide repeat protein [Catenulispora pinistramenti]MBS2535381.1 tetratricopeptide repeat protein [Catenulispora pinistramenti]MBS2552229.1 tetratricopeptide repeat protein [Catenulispora pinistramenti]